jgi:hypothetical protein
MILNISTSTKPRWNAVSMSCGKKALEVIAAACCGSRDCNTLEGIIVARGLYPKNAAKR